MVKIKKIKKQKKDVDITLKNKVISSGEIGIGLNVRQNRFEGSKFHNLSLVYSPIRRKIKCQQRYIPRLENFCSCDTICN